MIASLPSSPLSLCSRICFHFSLCVWQTAKKFQTVVILSQQPLLQLSLGRMARVSHLIMNALPGSWAWGRFSGGNSRNLIWWGRQRTVKPPHKNPGVRPQQHHEDSFTRKTTVLDLLFGQQHWMRRTWQKNRETLEKHHERFSWQIKWTYGKRKRHPLCKLSPLFSFPFFFFSTQRIRLLSTEWKYKPCQDMCDLLSWPDLKLHHWPSPHHSVQHSHSHTSCIIAPSQKMLWGNK